MNLVPQTLVLHKQGSSIVTVDYNWPERHYEEQFLKKYKDN